MFKIESYVTSMILSNADKYIKNFKKKDAQVSLWEGDASFQSIELNVDALNEEFQLPFVFTSGYIHDLTIHVPWTKLMSEPVTIFVNTIECVIKFRNTRTQKNLSCEEGSEQDDYQTEKQLQEEAHSQSSYTSSITNKIMNNLSLNFKNVILKLVEEDVVFSMNIEKFNLINANGQWKPAMTEMMPDKLTTHKLITLSGVTICLDKQNSSGRIDTYLDPLLYRCLINVRILRDYTYPYSKNPIRTVIHMHSDKMLFTVSEPQIPMLMKLLLIACGSDKKSGNYTGGSGHVIDELSTSSSGDSIHGDINEDNSWSSWIWNMVPPMMAQNINTNNCNNSADCRLTFKFGFFVKSLELNLKVGKVNPKKKVKIEFIDLFKSTLSGFVFQMIMKSPNWLNVQLGISHIGIIVPDKDDLLNDQVLISGIENSDDVLKETLFNDMSTYNTQYSVVDTETEMSDDLYDAKMHYRHEEKDFSIDTHLNIYTESVLLETHPAFVVDYIRSNSRASLHFESLEENRKFESSGYNQDDHVTVTDDDEFDKQCISDTSSTLLRFIGGKTIVRFSPEVISKIKKVYKIFEESTFASGGIDKLDESSQHSGSIPSHITQFTFFDLIIELSPSTVIKKGNEISESAVLSILCKCLDGNIIKSGCVNAAENRCIKTTSLKVIDINGSIRISNNESQFFSCGNLKLQHVSNSSNFKEYNLETNEVKLFSSKPNFLLASCILNSLSESIYYDCRSKYRVYDIVTSPTQLNDSLAANNIILETCFDDVKLTYQILNNVNVFRLFVNSVVAYCHSIDNQRNMKTIVFSVCEYGDSYGIEVLLQICTRCHAECQYPSSVWFNLKNLTFNLDPLFYKWLTYKTITIEQKTSKTKPNSREHTKVGSSRKISDASSGSRGIRIGGFYPKPKESVHSSTDYDRISPNIVSDVDVSDTFSAASCLEKKPFIENITDNVYLWKKIIVQGEITELKLFAPNQGTSVAEQDIHSLQVDAMFKEILKTYLDNRSGAGIACGSLKCFKIKSDVPTTIFEEFKAGSVMCIPQNIGYGDRNDELIYPCTLSMNGFCIGTLTSENISQPILKPLAATCIISISLKEEKTDSLIIGLFVHLDFQPIIIILAKEQINLINNVMNESVMLFEKHNSFIDAKEPNPVDSQEKEQNVEDTVKVNQFTGYIQCTFSKCCFSLTSNVDPETRKISAEIEDSIATLEFGDAFYKMKIKIGSLAINHYLRNETNDVWQKGQFAGVILQRCYSEEVSSYKSSEEENGFLQATITRVLNSNLESKLSSTQDFTVPFKAIGNRYTTEIVCQMCPVDIIVPIFIFDHFLTLFEPLMEFGAYSEIRSRNNQCSIYSANATTASSLPLIYFDISNIRLFLPVRNDHGDARYNFDTIMAEIETIQVNCEPENPIVRCRLQPDVPFSFGGKRNMNISESHYRNQQYKTLITEVTLNAGIWSEIEEMLTKEQVSVHEPPSVLEQNPAVMWNQGCRPHSKKKISLKHLMPLVSEFSCHILIAPPFKWPSSDCYIYAGIYEISIESKLNITLSLAHLILITESYDILKALLLRLTQNSVLSRTELQSDVNVPPKIVDSGIESLDQSSVDSSVFVRSSVIQQSSSKTQMRSVPESKIVPSENRAPTIFYVSWNDVNLSFFEVGYDADNINFKLLLRWQISQPYFFVKYTNSSTFYRFSIYKMSLQLPVTDEIVESTKNVNEKEADSVTLLKTNRNNLDPYSEIPFQFLTIRLTNDVEHFWKIEVNLEQSVSMVINPTYVSRFIDIFTRSFDEYTSSVNWNSENKMNQNQPRSIGAKRFYESVSAFSLNTNNFLIQFELDHDYRNLNLDIDSIRFSMKPFYSFKNLLESVLIQGLIKFMSLSSSETETEMCSKPTSNVILTPWTLEFELSLFVNTLNDRSYNRKPWKYARVNSENILIDVNPLSLQLVCDIVKEFSHFIEPYIESKPQPMKFQNDNSIEHFKDDLRAGAFHFIRDEELKCTIPSAYEVIFCNQMTRPYMCWRYPQPRCLVKLQVFPIPLQMDEVSNVTIYCQIQYFDEIRKTYQHYTSFEICERILIVPIPEKKPLIRAAECWRIVVSDIIGFDDEGKCIDINENFNIKSLVGCMRVDSSYNPEFVPESQLFFAFSEIQINLSTLSHTKNIKIDGYTLNDIPSEQNFLSFVCSNADCFISDFSEEKIVEASGCCKIEVLNYEHLMFQSLLEPVTFQSMLHLTKENVPVLRGIIKNAKVHVSPNFIHTLSTSTNLWNRYKSDNLLPNEIIASYIVCNGTNHVIMFCQENMDDCIEISPTRCHVYAWNNPSAPKFVKITVTFNQSRYLSNRIDMKKEGTLFVQCKTDDDKTCMIQVSVIKHSSVVRQVVIKGNVLIHNESRSDLCLHFVSLEKSAKHVSPSSKPCFHNVVSRKSQLNSIILPEGYRFSFKAQFVDYIGENTQWSGFIPLNKNTGPSNRIPWIVKIPIKDRKDHFLSVLCHVTLEPKNEPYRFFISFQSMCSVVSYLPCDSYVKIVDDIGNIVENVQISGYGSLSSLFIPDTVTLERYTLKWSEKEDSKEINKTVFSKHTSVGNDDTTYSIDTLINHIDNQNNERLIPKSLVELKWNTNKNHEIKTVMEVRRFENDTDGIVVEVYPWALIINSLSFHIFLEISDQIYNVEPQEVIVPPFIESSFKVGVTETENRHTSVILQLSNDQSFPIPKVTGRIPMNGYITVTVDCSSYICFMNISSQNYKKTRIVNFCSSYVVTNNSEWEIEYAAIVICKTSNKNECVDIPSNLEEILIKLPATKDIVQPVTKWTKIGSGNVHVLPYLILRINGILGCPVRICNLSEKQSYHVVFSSNSASRTPCLFIMAQQNDGQIYLNIWNEPTPQMIIHNNSALGLCVGAAKFPKGNEAVSYCPDWNWTFSVSAGAIANFNIQEPVANKHKKKQPQYIVFCVNNHKHVKETKWSHSLPVIPCVNHILTLPWSQHHIKISIFRNGFTFILWIESATMDELSAKMIRTRLSESFHPLNDPDVTTESNVAENKPEECKQAQECLKNIYGAETMVICDTILFIDEINAIFSCCDAVSNDENDLVTFSFVDVTLQLGSEQKENEILEEMLCKIEIRNFQLDNEHYHQRAYDFPVVLINDNDDRKDSVKPKRIDDLLSLQPYENSALQIVCALVLRKPLNFELRDIELTVNKLNAFLEDKYLSELNEAFNSLLSASSYQMTSLQSLDSRTTKSNILVKDTISSINLQTPSNVMPDRPLRLRTLLVSPFKVAVSVHTSTMFYIALDRSPLNFSRFERRYVAASAYELGALLSAHYLLESMYGTGWAIGALEFVGSPGALARTLGTGIRDFVSMPIHGIASGPRGFVYGVANGSASLMKHVMAGTISSVSKFAGSWARTLDRLTLNSDDLLRSEEIRRIQPNNITEGVLQGLTEFGISILGGISGIAHHPLQYAASNTGDKSFINSVSLGLIGVLTRPLSGAAEMVSRTGQGILSHVGWNTDPKVRVQSADKQLFNYHLATIKYKWIPRDEDDDILLAVEAVDSKNVSIPLAIVLTSKALIVFESLKNVEKFSFNLSSHEFNDCAHDPTLVVVLKPLLNLKDSEDFIQARILKFVTDTNKCFNIESPTTEYDKVNVVFSFCVNPQIKNFLLSMIYYVKNKQKKIDKRSH